MTGPTAQRRAKKARGRQTRYEKSCRIVDKRDGKPCKVCEQWVETGAHHHHIKPRSLGGSDTTDNLIRICGECHTAIHHDRTLTVTGNADLENGLSITWRDAC